MGINRLINVLLGPLSKKLAKRFGVAESTVITVLSFGVPLLISYVSKKMKRSQRKKNK